MQREQYMVRGTGIRTKFDFVQERFGEEAAERFRVRLFETIRWPILAGAWYPFDVYAKVLATVAEMFYGGSAASLREVGSYSAEQLLTSTYQAFRAAGELPRLIERLPSLYQRFYNCGEMVIAFHPDRNFCGFRFVGAPVYIQTDMEIAVGFTRRCLAFMGADATISELIVRPTEASFDLRWVMRPEAAAGTFNALATGGNVR